MTILTKIKKLAHGITIYPFIYTCLSRQLNLKGIHYLVGSDHALLVQLSHLFG
jgi:hypothetical protein